MTCHQLLKAIMYIFLMGWMMLSVTGCVDYFEMPKKVEYPPAFPRDYRPPPKTNGTIYQSGYEISLYDDRIAYHVGDVLTIRLQEATQGEKRARTRANKKASNIFTADEAFGANVSTGLALNTLTDQKFDGDGEGIQQNRLSGTISVTVIRVLSNGNLVVQGESWVTINFGKEYITLTGIVRRADIEPDNTVSSQRVADAKILYSGKGQIANVTRGGILTQFFNKYWPY